MRCQGLLRPAGLGQGFEAGLEHHLTDEGHELREDRGVRCRRDGLVEEFVAVRSAPAVVDLRPHRPECPVDGGEVLVRPALRREGGEPDLERAAGLDDVGETASMLAQALDDAGHTGAVTQHRSGPVLHVDHAEDLECHECLGQRRPGDAEPFGEIAFGGQEIAGAELRRFDVAEELLDELFVEPRAREAAERWWTGVVGHSGLPRVVVGLMLSLVD